MTKPVDVKREVLIGDCEVRKEILPALREFSKIVGATAGPKGKLVAIRKAGAAPHLTKDGMTVATAFSADSFSGVAVDMIRQSSIETGRRAGDGTTTASTLAVALYEALGNDDFETNDELVEKLESLKDEVEKMVLSRTLSVQTREQLFGVTYTACNGDETISEPITEAFMTLGATGAVTVEEDRSRTDVCLHWIDGTTFPAGYVSPYFVNDGSSKVVFENPFIWFSLTALTKPEHVVPVMQAVATHNVRNKENRPLVIVCDTISDEALSLLLVNNANGALPCCAINSPYLGNMRVTTMRDLAIVCGAKPTAREGLNNETALSFMGAANKVVIEPKLTSFFEPKGDVEEIKNLMLQLEEKIQGEVVEVERVTLQSRLGSLRGKAAVVKVGGSTHSQLVERKDRADDALASARWALLEGVLPGAGTTLMYIAKSLDSKELRSAFLAPVLQVFRNYSGLNDVSVEVPELFSRALEMVSENPNSGFDLRTGEERLDLIEAGVIDSSYALREAIRAAITTAISLAKLRAIVLNPEEANF